MPWPGCDADLLHIWVTKSDKICSLAFWCSEWNTNLHSLYFKLISLIRALHFPNERWLVFSFLTYGLHVCFLHTDIANETACSTSLNFVSLTRELYSPNECCLVFTYIKYTRRTYALHVYFLLLRRSKAASIMTCIIIIVVIIILIEFVILVGFIESLINHKYFLCGKISKYIILCIYQGTNNSGPDCMWDCF